MEIEKLKLALMQYGDDLQLYANGIAEDALAELEQTEAKIFEIAVKLYDKFEKKGVRPDKATLEYIENLKKKIAEIRSDIFESEYRKLKNTTAETAETANKFWEIFFAAAGVDILLLNVSELEKVGLYGIYNGNTVKQILDKLKNDDTDRIFDTLSDALQKGKSMKEAWEEVKDALNATNRFVKSEVDGIVNGAANDVSIGIALKNNMKLKYSAVMDKVTCHRCREFHGKVFPADSPSLPVIPQHYNCRCQLLVVNDKGESVESATFSEFLKQLPAAEQKKRLGSKKYTAWTNGSYLLRKYEPPMPGQKKELSSIVEDAKKLLKA